MKDCMILITQYSNLRSQYQENEKCYIASKTINNLDFQLQNEIKAIIKDLPRIKTTESEMP